MVPTLLVVVVVAVAPRTGKIIKEEEKVFYKLVYYTLYLGSPNCQKSRWKVRIYVDEKPTFLKEA